MSIQTTYISDNSVSIIGNYTDIFVTNRRLKFTTTDTTYIYSTVYSSTYVAPNTIITTNESNLVPAINEIAYGIVSSDTAGSLPDHTHGTDSGDGGEINFSTTENLGYVNINENLSSNYSYSGPTSIVTVGENVIYGDFLYRNLSDNKYYKAQANSALTAPAMRMALATAVADTSCLTLCPGGIARDDSWNWTNDGTVLELYLSASVAGDLTEVVDTSTNCIGQVIANPLASNKIEFCPSLVIVRF